MQASLETTGGDLGRDLVLAYQTGAAAHRRRPRSPRKQPGEDGYFLLTLTAGEELAKLDQGMDYVFVLDVSGSMSDDGKLELSRGSLGAFVDALGSEDRFEMIAFNVQPASLFGELRDGRRDDPSRGRGVPRSAGRRAAARSSSRRCATAYRYKDADRPLNVVVLCDGMTEQRERAASCSG